jgi:hypothetical protein
VTFDEFCVRLEPRQVEAGVGSGARAGLDVVVAAQAVPVIGVPAGNVGPAFWIVTGPITRLPAMSMAPFDTCENQSAAPPAPAVNIDW